KKYMCHVSKLYTTGKLVLNLRLKKAVYVRSSNPTMIHDP
ncbi:MAG: hypothetical protein ACI90V_010674, partial [Bacillariaceae sp.]